MIRAWFVGAGLLLAAASAVAQAPAAPATAPAQAPASAAAPAPAAPKAWSSMSPQQQQLLHGYQGKWESLPPERQQALASAVPAAGHPFPLPRSVLEPRTLTRRAWGVGFTTLLRPRQP